MHSARQRLALILLSYTVVVILFYSVSVCISGPAYINTENHKYVILCLRLAQSLISMHIEKETVDHLVSSLLSVLVVYDSLV